MVTIGRDGEALIKHFEGCKLTAYPDPATGGDPWTIGWGTTGKDVHQGLVWTQAQCDARFHKDIGDFAVSVSALLGKAVTGQHQFDALCSFAYNLGTGNLKASTKACGGRLCRGGQGIWQMEQGQWQGDGWFDQAARGRGGALCHAGPAGCAQAGLKIL
jgi:hypothetical protein